MHAPSLREMALDKPMNSANASAPAEMRCFLATCLIAIGLRAPKGLQSSSFRRRGRNLGFGVLPKPATDGDDDAATAQIQGGTLSQRSAIDQPEIFSLLCRNAPHDASSIKFPRLRSLQRSAPSINQQAPCLRSKPLYCGSQKSFTRNNKIY